MTYDAQLWLGVAAFLEWIVVFLVWFRGRALPGIVAAFAVVALVTSLVILVGGSLYLKGDLTDDLWFVIGTLGRAIVAGLGLASLILVLRKGE